MRKRLVVSKPRCLQGQPASCGAVHNVLMLWILLWKTVLLRLRLRLGTRRLTPLRQVNVELAEASLHHRLLRAARERGTGSSHSDKAVAFRGSVHVSLRPLRCYPGAGSRICQTYSHYSQ